MPGIPARHKRQRMRCTRSSECQRWRDGENISAPRAWHEFKRNFCVIISSFHFPRTAFVIRPFHAIAFTRIPRLGAHVNQLLLPHITKGMSWARYGCRRGESVLLPARVLCADCAAAAAITFCWHLRKEIQSRTWQINRSTSEVRKSRKQCARQSKKSSRRIDFELYSKKKLFFSGKTENSIRAYFVL